MKQKIQTKIKVFLVDDHPLLREGVRSYLTNHLISVVGEASDAKEALRKVKKLAPDVIVLDVNLPDLNGGELARRLHPLVPKTRLIAFSIHSGEAYVVRMAHCGVQGYVMKDQPAADLLEAIKNVYQGGLYFPSSMTDALLAPLPESSPDQPGNARTDRDLEIMTLLAKGLSKQRHPNQAR